MKRRRRGAVAGAALIALAASTRPAAADDPLVSQDLALGGTAIAVIGSLGWIGGECGLVAAARETSADKPGTLGTAFDRAGRMGPGFIAADLGAGLISIGASLALSGALRRTPRSKGLAIAGIPITGLGAGALVIGTSLLPTELGRAGGPLAAAVAVGGAGLSALGLTLYVLGNRRANAPGRPRDPNAPAPENHWLILGPTSAVAGWRF